MKFPLMPRPYRPIDLPQELRDEYETTIDRVLHETVAEFDDFVYRQRRVINAKNWKVLKTRENITVMKQISGLPKKSRHLSNASSGGSSSTSSDNNPEDWQGLPPLLSVGTLVANLEDVMYGVVSPSTPILNVKYSYIDAELVDAMVLCQLEAPTTEDPVHHHSLNWIVKAHPVSVDAVTWPRDFVLLDAAGIKYESDGSKIGYLVMHSVPHPQYPELSNLGIIRGQLSAVYLFRQVTTDRVEVYMKSYVEPAGKLLDALALMSAVNGLIASWKLPWCGQHKKLAYLVNNTPPPRPSKIRVNDRGKQCCALCSHTFSLRTPAVCCLCTLIVCSRCKAGRKLSYLDQRGRVRRRSMVFCKQCITNCNQMSAVDVARAEYVGDNPSVQDNRRWMSQSDTSSEFGRDTFEFWGRGRSQHQHINLSTTTSSTLNKASVVTQETDDEVVLEDRMTSMSSIDLEGSSLMSMDLGAVDFELASSPVVRNLDLDPRALESLSTLSINSPDTASIPEHEPEDPQQRMWMQLQKLQRQAEVAFMTTQSNNAMMREARSRQGSRT